MGQEILCSAQFDGKSSVGKALLETQEIIFRGDVRLKIRFSEIREVTASNGDLRVKTAGGLAVLKLGPKAEIWRDKILHPKSVIEKLGVRPGERVALHGSFARSFREDLRKQGARISAAPAPAWIFLAADSSRDLAAVEAVAGQLQGAAALWIVYPKGQKSITEHSVRQAGLAAGLVDVKVAGFSPSHTALKFVVPRSKR